LGPEKGFMKTAEEGKAKKIETKRGEIFLKGGTPTFQERGSGSGGLLLDQIQKRVWGKEGKRKKKNTLNAYEWSATFRRKRKGGLRKRARLRKAGRVGAKTSGRREERRFLVYLKAVDRDAITRELSKGAEVMR